MRIVENLLIGHRLEQGKIRIRGDCVADLKAIHNPLVIFASSGDNITAPHQALNWVPAVEPTTKALKDAGQRIVYLLNSHAGHLGLFVSAAVAKPEHRAILESLEHRWRAAPQLRLAEPQEKKQLHRRAVETRTCRNLADRTMD